jgi:hypothetical protein
MQSLRSWGGLQAARFILQPVQRSTDISEVNCSQLTWSRDC